MIFFNTAYFFYLRYSKCTTVPSLYGSLAIWLVEFAGQSYVIEQLTKFGKTDFSDAQNSLELTSIAK